MVRVAGIHGHGHIRIQAVEYTPPHGDERVTQADGSAGGARQFRPHQRPATLQVRIPSLDLQHHRAAVSVDRKALDEGRMGPGIGDADATDRQFVPFVPDVDVGQVGTNAFRQGRKAGDPIPVRVGRQFKDSTPPCQWKRPLPPGCLSGNWKAGFGIRQRRPPPASG